MTNGHAVQQYMHTFNTYTVHTQCTQCTHNVNPRTVTVGVGGDRGGGVCWSFGGIYLSRTKYYATTKPFRHALIKAKLVVVVVKPLTPADVHLDVKSILGGS